MAKRYGKREPVMPEGMSNSLVDAYGSNIDDGYRFDEKDDDEPDFVMDREGIDGPADRFDIDRYNRLSTSDRAKLADEEFSEIVRKASEAEQDQQMGF